MVEQWRWFFNTLRPRRNGRHFPDGTFKHIFLIENVRISSKISLKFVPRGPISNIPALVQIMAWRRPGDKPLSEPMTVSLLTHICVIRPQWVNSCKKSWSTSCLVCVRNTWGVFRVRWKDICFWRISRVTNCRSYQIVSPMNAIYLMLVEYCQGTQLTMQLIPSLLMQVALQYSR